MSVSAGGGAESELLFLSLLVVTKPAARCLYCANSMHMLCKYFLLYSCTPFVLQALQFLVLDHKGSLTLEDITQHICPALNHQQMYRLCTTAWDDAPAQVGVPGRC